MKNPLDSSESGSQATQSEGEVEEVGGESMDPLHVRAYCSDEEQEEEREGEEEGEKELGGRGEDLDPVVPGASLIAALNAANKQVGVTISIGDPLPAYFYTGARAAPLYL